MRAELLVAACVGTLAAITGSAGYGPIASPRAASVRAAGMRPAIDSINLEATSDARGASGVAVLTRTQSPFGMTLTADGHVMYDVHIRVSGLPADPHVYDGASTYVAWATVPDLSLARRLGPLGADGSASGEVEWNKFIVLVTAEKPAEKPGTTPPHWGGAILLKGASPSTWMQRYQSHVLNNGGNPQW